MDEKAKFGVIAWILSRLDEKRLYYGTVIAQKIMYFLQEGFGVDLGYHFYFYHYGPYSDELDRDLKIMKLYQIISIGYDPKELGYSIKLESEANIYLDYAKPIINKYSKNISEVVELFGNLRPADLELLSTIHYVNTNNKKLRKITRIEKVQKLKPKFSIDTIKTQYDWLARRHLLN